MIATYRPSDVERAANLVELDARLRRAFLPDAPAGLHWRELVELDCRRRGFPRPVGGGTNFGGVENKLGLVGSGPAVANTVSESSLLGREFVRMVGADYFATRGQRYRFTAYGTIGTTGTPTIQFKWRHSTSYASPLGGNMITQTAAITTGSGLANVNWWIDILGVVRAEGASGSILAVGKLTSAIVSATDVYRALTNATPPTAVSQDLSLPQFMDLTATWGTANASNTITCLDAAWESMD